MQRKTAWEQQWKETQQSVRNTKRQAKQIEEDKKRREKEKIKGEHTVAIPKKWKKFTKQNANVYVLLCASLHLFPDFLTKYRPPMMQFAKLLETSKNVAEAGGRYIEVSDDEEAVDNRDEDDASDSNNNDDDDDKENNEAHIYNICHKSKKTKLTPSKKAKKEVCACGVVSVC